MEIYWARISNKLAITLSQIDSPPACVYSYCTATTTAAVRGGVAPGGLLHGRGSLALLSGSLPSIRSRKQASTLGLWVTLMVQFLSISEDHIGIYETRLLYILAPHIQVSTVRSFFFVWICKLSFWCILHNRKFIIIGIHVSDKHAFSSGVKCQGAFRSMFRWMYMLALSMWNVWSFNLQIVYLNMSHALVAL